MLLEILRASPQLEATEVAEDKNVFYRSEKLPENYLSKCDTVYVPDFGMAKRLLDDNPELRILWTIRDLRDTALSKIYRGQPGHDSPTLSDDATHEGCIKDLEWMRQIYKFVKANYPDRIMVVKMEDVILIFEDTVKEVCNFCQIEYTTGMEDFTSRYRNKHKASRYRGLDSKQVAIYKNLETVYNGFFNSHSINIDSLFSDLKPFQEEFGYE
jgi:hypothetical protein